MSRQNLVAQGLELREAVCLVTGGTRGIGAAISKRFLETGGSLIVTARSEESFESFRGTLEPDERRRVQFLKVDFSDQESLEKLINDLQELPRLDVPVEPVYF